jgi:hypothetical protein
LQSSIALLIFRPKSDEFLRQRDIALGDRNEFLRQRNMALIERDELLRQRDIALGEHNELLLRRRISMARSWGPADRPFVSDENGRTKSV